MGSWWRDIISTALVIFGGVVMFAKLESYNWWLIGSWKGALGVLAATGAVLFLVNLRQLIEMDNLVTFFELLLWAGIIAFFATALSVATTKTEFIVGGALLGAAWLVRLSEDIWVHLAHQDSTRYVSSH